MKILVLSFYFQPDLSAGSFRNTALVEALQGKISKSSHIEVMTTLPNRYSSFSEESLQREERTNLTIHRFALPLHQSGMLDQSRAFLSYANQVMKMVKDKEYDLVYASSSRLMTAALGAWVSCRKNARLYLDIRDIFVDTIKDVLPRKIVWLIKPFFSIIERWVVTKASKVNLVSGGFLPYFENRYPIKRFSLFTNGIDEEFIKAQPTARSKSARDLLEVVYAGNLGEGQGLHNILPVLAKNFEDRLRFKVVGDGGRHKQLVDAIKNSGCSNVELLPPVSRNELIKIYQDADILFLHLNDYDAFKRVLPSKIFEYAALGKPIWAGVAGFSANFIENNIANAVVFPPCDAKKAMDSFAHLQLVTEPRLDFTQRFARAVIMNGLVDELVSVAG